VKTHVSTCEANTQSAYVKPDTNHGKKTNTPKHKYGVDIGRRILHKKYKNAVY